MAGKRSRVEEAGSGSQAAPQAASGRPGARTLIGGGLPRTTGELPLGLPAGAVLDDPAPGKLTEDARNRLTSVAYTHIITTIGGYYHALDAVKDAVHERAKAKTGPTFLGLVIDVIAGTLLPGLAGNAVNKALSMFVDARSSDELTELALFVVEGDRVESLVMAALGGVNAEIKGAFAELAPDQTKTDDFIFKLGAAARVQLVRLATSLEGRPEGELMALALAYDPETNSDVVMRDRIAEIVLKFQKQIEPIGHVEREVGEAHASEKRKTLALIKTAESEKLALVTRFATSLRATREEIGEARYRLEEWISDDMKALAYERFMDSGQEHIPRLDAGAVWEPGTPDSPRVRLR